MPSTPACTICNREFYRLSKRRKICFRCVTLPQKVKQPKTILEELGLSWIGKYYSTLDPRVWDRFRLRRQK